MRVVLLSTITITITILTPTLALSQWVAPKGIPTPSFGITDTAGATTVSVSTAQTIPNPVSAGSVVTLATGTHTTSYTNAQILRCNGTVGSPVFIRGSGILATTISGKFDVIGTYCIIENIKFLNQNVLATSVLSSALTHHLVFRDIEVAGNGVDDGGMSIGASGSGVTSDVVILRANIHDSGDLDFNGDQDVHGVSLGGSQLHDIWLLDSIMERGSGDGLQINCGFTNPGIEGCHHFYIGRNRANTNRQSGLSVKGAVDIIFSENDTYDAGAGLFSSGCEPGLGYQYDHQRIWFIFNYSHDNCIGIRAASDFSGLREDVYILGNRFIDNTAVGIQPNGNHLNDFFVAHNTITGSPKSFENSFGGPGTPVISSNVLTGTVTTGGSPAWTLTQRNNVTTQGASVDAGVSESPYATFLAIYGRSIQVDFNGVSRPQGGVWDSGATEPAVGGGGGGGATKYPWALSVKP